MRRGALVGVLALGFLVPTGAAASAAPRPFIPTCRVGGMPVPPGSPVCPVSSMDSGRSAATETGLPPCVLLGGINDRCPTWTATFDNPNGYATGGYDVALASAASPDGRRVYVTGFSQDDASGYDILTVAQDASTGAIAWTARADDGGDGLASAIAMSPDGATVYVGGVQSGDLAVVAYEAATGAERWRAQRDGPRGAQDAVFAIAVAPDGSRVYATGPQDQDAATCYSNAGCNIVTLALDAATGQEVWVATFDGDGAPPKDWDFPAGIAVAPDGERVYVAGAQFTTGKAGLDFVALAYEAEDPEHLGELLWREGYNGSLAGFFNYDYPSTAALSPDGATFYAAGGSDPGTGPLFGSLAPQDYATVAFDTVTGARRWAARYRGAANGWNLPSAMAPSPDGNRVYVTGMATGLGTIDGTTYDWDVGTVAYDADGRQAWADTYGRPGYVREWGAGVAVDPGGGRVYVGGTSGVGYSVYLGTLFLVTPSPPVAELVAVAYDASGGGRTWVGRYGEPGDATLGYDLALSPDGRRAFVTGARAVLDPDRSLQGPSNGADLLTVAYEV